MTECLSVEEFAARVGISGEALPVKKENPATDGESATGAMARDYNPNPIIQMNRHVCNPSAREGL